MLVHPHHAALAAVAALVLVTAAACAPKATPDPPTTLSRAAERAPAPRSGERSAEDTRSAAARLLPEAIADLRLDGYLSDEATEALEAGVPTALYDLGRKPVKSADYFSQMVAGEADAIVHVPVINRQEVLGEFEMRRSGGVWILEGSGGGPSDRFAAARRQLATAGFARGESRQVMTRWGLALFVRQGDRAAAVFLYDSPWLPKGAVEAQRPEAGHVYAGDDLWKVLGPAPD